MDQMLTKLKSLHSQHDAFKNLVSGYSSVAHKLLDRGDLDNWILTQVKKALDSLSTCDPQDAYAMVELGEKHGVDFLIERYGIQNRFG